MKSFHKSHTGKIVLLFFLVGVMVVSAACGSTTTSQKQAQTDGNKVAVSQKPEEKPANQSSSSPEWDNALKAARTEGKLSIGIPLGEAFPKIMDRFQKAYPDIKVEKVSIHTSNFTARVQEERNNGKFLWDVFIGGPDIDLYSLGNKGFWDDIKPDIINKDIMDNSKWIYGFDAGFSDKNKKYSYNFGTKLWSGAFYVNRDFIPESELKTVDDLVKSDKFKGKIAWQDPRGSGSGVNSSAIIMDHYSEETLRSLYKNNDIVVTPEQRQLIEWAVRGRYPIVVGLLDRELKVMFQSQGLGKNVQNVVIPGVVTAIPGSNSVVAINKAPNPNARKIFLNWLLSQEGQATFAEITSENSRRLDVKQPDPEGMPKPELKEPPLNTQSEAFAPMRKKANEISKELLK